MAYTRTIHDADALLLYRVGPVYCCSPTMPVVSVQLPPRLNHPPGSNVSRPGVFRFASGIVRVVDLRQCFGVEPEDREQPGKIVVTEVEGGQAGFWVDEIIDVIQCPRQGWGGVPALVPKDVFTRTLLFNDHIQLYAEFEKFNDFRETGYLRQHIQTLKDRQQTAAAGDEQSPSAAQAIAEQNPPAPADHPRAIADVSVESNAEADKTTGLKPPGSAPDVPEATLPRADSRHVLPDVEQQRSAARPPTTSAGSAERHQVSVKPAPSRERAAAATGGRPPLTSPATAAIPGRSTPIMKAALEPVGLPPRHADGTADSYGRHAVGKPPGENDSGVWALLFMVLLLVMVGIYLFTDREDAEPAPGFDEVQQTPLPVTPMPDSAVNEPLAGAVQKAPADRSPHVDELQPPVPNEGRPEYRATINRDEQGLVIVLDAVDEEPLKTALPDVGVATEWLLAENGQLDTTESGGEQPTSTRPVQEPQPGSTEVSSAAANSRPVSKTIVHVVVRGDTLWHIAKRYIHNPYRYPELARLSKINNPDLIYPGDRVKIIINKSRP